MKVKENNNAIPLASFLLMQSDCTTAPIRENQRIVFDSVACTIIGIVPETPPFDTIKRDRMGEIMVQSNEKIIKKYERVGKGANEYKKIKELKVIQQFGLYNIEDIIHGLVSDIIAMSGCNATGVCDENGYTCQYRAAQWKTITQDRRQMMFKNMSKLVLKVNKVINLSFEEQPINIDLDTVSAVDFFVTQIVNNQFLMRTIVNDILANSGEIDYDEASYQKEIEDFTPDDDKLIIS